MINRGPSVRISFTLSLSYTSSTAKDIGTAAAAAADDDD